ncbi:hypothetical protein BH23GEM2_BH23GEM2_08630 [soil metagenome]
MLGQLALRRLPDAQRRGVVRAELRMYLLQRLQLPEEAVVLGIGERGPVQNVVLISGAVQDLTQRGRALRRSGAAGGIDFG